MGSQASVASCNKQKSNYSRVSSRQGSNASKRSQEKAPTKKRYTINDPAKSCFIPERVGERDRSNTQHFALKSLFEGNFFDSIKKYVDFEHHVQILDIGCGSGAWAMDTATEYPTASFIAIDRAAIFPTSIHPANVAFECLDIADVLPYKDNHFDFVHLGSLAFALQSSQWAKVLKEAYRVTKPGGCIQLMEAQLISPGNELVLYSQEKLKSILLQHGQNPYLYENLGAMLSEAGFKIIQEEKRTVVLNNHILADEFMHILSESVDACMPFVMSVDGLESSEEFQAWKSAYLAARRDTSDVTWFGVAARKPTQS
ncbi:S-adenosyl-L-methionine-dependent methyltransferase [Phycomyces blakesleeanus]|uniref:Methyltransferase domain-containing protein n=2 Tax=Phycomyces blakesleeanus TaxID=4837 RepID=A0A162ZVY1_PHYB8|nr:hypothetical protein PHYBLDRAFT_182959 [Phycomyces blakesleeanus NRRL 1555(-)]OAD69381.1 hypothetical protein PHYBLDRAFT_182959 [Phycomyces blakesleeanus NRRL 1555(-)]|eukprot:XP_018287421.1 hypothetical protein PHYBLDRAFT_182959 [Phycomyces blakesleeanus NRRL 1555(-)]